MRPDVLPSPSVHGQLLLPAPLLRCTAVGSLWDPMSSVLIRTFLHNIVEPQTWVPEALSVRSQRLWAPEALGIRGFRPPAELCGMSRNRNTKGLGG